MPLRITREGMGRGAERQYHLLRQHWDIEAVEQNIHLYFNAFTRNIPRLIDCVDKGHYIISRVGGWHFESEDQTREVLNRSCGAIFVSDYTRQLAKKRFGYALARDTVIVNSTEPRPPRPLANPPYLLVRAGGLGYPVWKHYMLSRSLSIFALNDIWDELKREYPRLKLRIIGRVHHKIKELVPPKRGIEYLDYIDDREALHDLGARAAALVHLVFDHSPNTVAEMIGEGRPVIVFNLGGAPQLADRAGLQVEVNVSGTKDKNLDIWCPLDGKTYRASRTGLKDRVCQVLDNHKEWQRKAVERAEQIASPKKAAEYMEFMQSCARPGK